MIQIGGIQKLTLIDYPGRLSATVFLLNCNFRCPFCYSSELVLPEKTKNQSCILEKDFFAFLEERKDLLEGVVICGGEPMMNKDLPDFVRKIKEMGYKVKVDTNGSFPEMLEFLIDEKIIDYVALDIKAPKEKYNILTGGKVNIKNIEKSISILKNKEIDYEFRTTVVPTLLKKEDILKISRWLFSFPSRKATRYYLQNFRPEKTLDPKLEKLKPYPLTYLLEIQRAVSPFFDICQIRE